jgi:hypothetical protein
MVDNKDLEAEIHPLKNEDRKSQENLGNRLKNEDNLKSKTPQSRLSRCRTVAFFLSLFICLFVVFVVSFIIPCPDRPVSERMWKIDYNAAGEPRPCSPGSVLCVFGFGMGLCQEVYCKRLPSLCLWLSWDFRELLFCCFAVLY